jgi:hypothetical protein
VTGDGRADVVEGLPVRRFVDEDSDQVAPSGAVRIWRGTRTGPGRKAALVTKRAPGVPGENQREDGFGSAVAVGNVDRDRYADIVVGAPGERGGGSVTLVRGASSGHARKRNASYGLATADVPGKPGGSQSFGSTLALLDFNGDRRLDLAVGAPEWSDAPASVFALRGARRGFTGTGSRVIRGRAVGVPDIGEGAFPIDTTPFGAVLGRPSSSE